MEFSKKQVEELMTQYLQDNDDYGNENVCVINDSCVSIAAEP